MNDYRLCSHKRGESALHEVLWASKSLWESPLCRVQSKDIDSWNERQKWRGCPCQVRK